MLINFYNQCVIISSDIISVSFCTAHKNNKPRRISGFLVLFA